MSNFSRIFGRLGSFALLAGLVAGAGFVVVSCTKTVTNPGGDFYGPADQHCIDPTGAMITQITDQAACQYTSCAGHPLPCTPDAGTPLPVDAPPSSPYGTTMFNQSGNDDDCKYSVSWTANPILENSDVFFTVTATTTVDNQPATGANIIAEVFLDDQHAAPPTNSTTVESPPGTYKIGPIRFDKPGAWTVRFHLHEDCKDLVEDSPHGHAAFYVDVP